LKASLEIPQKEKQDTETPTSSDGDSPHVQQSGRDPARDLSCKGLQNPVIEDCEKEGHK